MSIASEITRIQGAKANLKTAIEGKGVTVPSSTKLDGYADLVDDIQTGGGDPNLQDKTVSYTPTESQQTATVTADSGYDGLDEVSVTVGAIDSEYVGSDIPRNTSSNLLTEGATVIAPSGYYENSATKTVQMGTEGTPTATKGTVANHSVDITPSVTNVEGYIQGGTKNGSAVKVSASELVSGTLEIDSSGTKDVTNYKNVSVPSGTEGTPTASKGAVSNHSVSVTPSVINMEGYIEGGTKTGTAVSVSASELVSGTKSVTQNGTEDVTNYASVSVSVPNSYSASDEGKVVNNGALIAQTSDTVTANDTYDTTLINSLTVNVSGGGGISVDDIAQNIAPSGVVTLSNSATSLGQYALAGKPITNIYAPSVTSIATYSLQNTQITTITDANFPVYGHEDLAIVLLRMSSLVSIKLSGEKIALSSGSGALRDNANLERVEFPNCAKNVGASYKSMGSSCFYGDTKLEFADLGFCQSIGSNGFYNCGNLRTLVLRRTDAVVTLNAWNSNTIKGIYNNPTESTIYVPQALISTYQTATNWKTGYTAGLTFLKIEGSIYEI